MKKLYSFVLLFLIAGTFAMAQNQMDGLVQSYFNVLKGESDFKAADLTQWTVTDVVPSLNPNIQHVYVQQMHNGIPIQYATYKLTVNNSSLRR